MVKLMKKIISNFVWVLGAIVIVLIYFNTNFGIPIWIIQIILLILFLYYVLFNIKFWRGIGRSINYLFEKRSRWITFFSAILILFLHIYFVSEIITDVFNKHDFVPGRDTVISSHREYISGDSGPGYNNSETTVTVIDSWYDPYHEMHRYTNNTHNEVEWLDLNKTWHVSHTHRSFGIWFLVVYVILLFVEFRIIQSRANRVSGLIDKSKHIINFE